MAPETFENRVELLELRVEGLEQLPARVTSIEGQILELREEMRVEFSAVRQEMRTLIEQTNMHMRVLHEEVLARFALLEDRWKGARKRKR